VPVPPKPGHSAALSPTGRCVATSRPSSEPSHVGSGDARAAPKNEDQRHQERVAVGSRNTRAAVVGAHRKCAPQARSRHQGSECCEVALRARRCEGGADIPEHTDHHGKARREGYQQQRQLEHRVSQIHPPEVGPAGCERGPEEGQRQRGQFAGRLLWRQPA